MKKTCIALLIVTLLASSLVLSSCGEILEFDLQNVEISPLDPLDIYIYIYIYQKWIYRQ